MSADKLDREAWDVFLGEVEEQEGSEVAQQLRDVADAILAGLDQMRKGLDLKMGDVPWPRMGELARRIAIETVDYTPLEGLLVGGYLAASARAQLTTDAE